jgi:site-specific DNA-methyltransferase (adenine-specific)
MTDADLIAMRHWIDSIAAANCALFLWATCPRLDFATRLIRWWGFRYATVAFHWVKTTTHGKLHMGPGSYTASNPELVLLGVRGSMPPSRRLLPSVVESPEEFETIQFHSSVMEHSRKPKGVLDRINLMYPDERKIELFCRYPSPGWDCWGNEAGLGQTEIPLEVA